MKENFEDMLDAIRVDLYERTKDISNSEAARVINEDAKKIADQYGIKIVKGTISYAEKYAVSS